MDIDIVSVFPEYFDVLNLSLLGKAKSKGLISVHAHNLRDWTHDVHQSVDIDIVSVFPEYFDVLNLSLLGKAKSKGLISVHAHNLRDWTHDVHQSVDDTPVGGGAGMVMKPAVWAECLDELLDIQAEDTDRPILIFPNPSAPLFTQQDATELSHAQHLVFGCGRYEGYDARIPAYYRERGVDVREYSIGDYVLNGGEVAVSVMLEAITRLLPGFMGNPDSIIEESYTGGNALLEHNQYAVSVMLEAITRLLPGFMGNPDSIIEESYTGGNALLEHNQYTKPASWRGLDVPAVLLSGDHAKVDRFRRDEALEKTNRIRPDLIAQLDCHALSKADRKTLIELGWEVSGDHPRRIS